MLLRNLGRLLVAVLIGTLAPAAANAQFGNNFGAVGGVVVSAEGALRAGKIDAKLLRDELTKVVKKAPAGLNEPTELRMISLKAVSEALAKAGVKSTADLPQDLQCLAGIQRIQYIFVYPEQRDIVLAGPGEGWKVDENANIVGVTTGRPVLQLDDLLVAFRTVDNARQGGITCSIDPTAEGRRNLDAFLAKQKVMNNGVKDGVEKAMGAQEITVRGVPVSSRFARTLVTSDYRMKRIAMSLEKSPLASLPSFIDVMMKTNTKLDNMMPRWWLACDYEPIAKGADGLAWEIKGRGVKVLTEDEQIGADGSVKQTGKVNPAAKKWADLMTAKYEELSVKEPVFAELQTIMDMSVVAALITKEQLAAQANCDLTALTAQSGGVTIAENAAAKSVDTQCSTLKHGKEWIITASGGVEINSWQIADRTVADKAVDAVRATAAGSGDGWVWNK